MPPPSPCTPEQFVDPAPPGHRARGVCCGSLSHEPRAAGDFMEGMKHGSIQGQLLICGYSPLDIYLPPAGPAAACSSYSPCFSKRNFIPAVDCLPRHPQTLSVHA